ncbi:hypothetical protein [Cellulosimicrobium sp. CUA-896]|nr:hypothetical protein [Cellulosimicrobium sp. CUA-896]
MGLRPRARRERGELLLCAEHFRTHEATLDARGYAVSWGATEHPA